ncbi:MAG: hypothetical protein GX838_07040 [Clostridiaceae bacterium]|nr:hypothetical protein [Clostridiaceae bacterium]
MKKDDAFVIAVQVVALIIGGIALSSLIISVADVTINSISNKLANRKLKKQIKEAEAMGWVFEEVQ